MCEWAEREAWPQALDQSGGGQKAEEHRRASGLELSVPVWEQHKVAANLPSRCAHSRATKPAAQCGCISLTAK